MYTSYIGKKFLKLYNEKSGTELSAEVFFNDYFFELFFTDEAHLMHVGNSPFFQKPKEDDVKKYGSKSLAQLENLKQNILNDVPNMSIFVGAAARDIGGTTSGQVSSIAVDIDIDEMYASWIGEALAIGVNGGFVMLIDESEILWKLYEGWKYYRDYISQTPNVKDKQIETWNGQWIYHCLSNCFDEAFPFDNLNIETTEVQGNVAIPTQPWSKIVFSLSKKYPNNVLTVYAYNLSQTNTTLGFINLYLKEVHEMYELRDQLFLNEKETILSDTQIEQLSTFYNFKSACQFGTIGLKTLEPAKLREFMPKGSVQYAQGKDFKFNNEESYFNYKLYKIWITAMLNKTELLKLASEIAKSLIDLEGKEERGKKVLSTLSGEVRNAKNLITFIDKITEVLDELPDSGESMKATVEQVLKMPSDNFPLFITLIRFEYTYQKAKN
jgi:hypothetical protein